MQLQFNVKNQSISRVDTHEVVGGSKNYLTAHFSFSDEWDGVVKTAVFKNGDGVYNVLLKDDMCLVPWEVITPNFFSISVFGGDLITVDTVNVVVFESGASEGGMPSEPTPDVYNQILTSINETKEIAQSVRDDADNGVFNGEPFTYEDFTPEQLEALKGPTADTSNFATKEDLETKADKSEIPDVSEFATKSDLPIETNSNEPLKTISASSSSITINNEKYGTNYVYQAKTEKDDDLPLLAKSKSSTSSVNSSTNFCVDITMNSATGAIKCKDVIVNNESVATKAEIPTKTSDLINDSDFITSEEVKNTTKMLDDEHKNILLSNGTYDGKDVEDGFVFTSPDGKLVGFDKTLNPGGDWGTSTGRSQEYVDSRGLYGNGVISISAVNGGNAYSTDKGRTWSWQASGPGSTFAYLGTKTAAFNGTSFIGLSGNSLYTSDDGIAWTYKSSVSGIPTGYSTMCFEYGNGIYVAGMNNGKLYYSSDYTNWTEAIQMSGKYASCTCFANGKFVAITTTKVYTSENGADWVETSKPSGNGKQCAGGNSIFVISDVESWTTGLSNKFFYSTDGGLTWKTSYTASSRNWCGLTWCGDRFFAVAHKDNLYTYSFDGINWIEGTMPQWDYWSTVTYADGEIVVTCGRATGKTSVAYASFHPFYEYGLTDLSFNKAEVIATVQGKTTISELTAQTTLANNAIFRANEMSSVELLIPETIEDDFICEVDFTSGETATAFTIVDTVKWTGDDITDNAFVPDVNKRYTLMFWYDGLLLNAIVRGVSL